MYSKNITRLGLGVSRFEKLDRRVMPVFLDRSWMHFGDDVDMRPRNLGYLLREYTLPQIAKFAFQKVSRRQRSLSPGDDPYDKTNFQPWFYTKGDTLNIAGFEPVPLRYCDREGNYVIRSPADLKDCYGVCPDPAVVFDLSSIIRSDVLMVDRVKLRCRESELAHGRPPKYSQLRV